ncbi:MAG: Maf family protein [Deltaproteobacteria bacterium]|nr:Maf family protein [Deltaproteobacteria bacterium]
MGLILGSASPRRARLLGELGVAFRVAASDVPEVPAPGETAAQFAARAAREKGAAVAALHAADWVLAADTVVTVEGAILGKPVDDADARRMLRQLSDRVHEVLTAVALFAPGAGCVEEGLGRSTVEFRSLSDDEIAAYVAGGEPADKAGAYAIQGGAAGFVTRVTGSLTNVIGLPTELVAALLERHGLAAAPAAAHRA